MKCSFPTSGVPQTRLTNVLPKIYNEQRDKDREYQKEDYERIKDAS